jgi:hypothetical protein
VIDARLRYCSDMRTGILLVAVLAAASCSDKKKADPGPTQPAVPDPAKPSVADDETATEVEPDPGTGSAAPKPPATQVDLVLSGTVVATLKGAGGRCTCAADKATYQIRSGDLGVKPDFDLTVLVTSPEEWANPSIILNVKSPQRGSYGRNLTKHRAEDKLSVAKDCTGVVLEDVVLRGISSKGEVTLKGSIRCGA